MLILLRRIAKNILKVYMPAYTIESILRVAMVLFPDNMTVGIIHQLWVMMSATFLIGYSVYDLYAFVYTRKHFFLYTTKYSIENIFLIYTTMYIIGNIIFYLLYSPFDLANLWFKIVSLISFYFVNATVLLFAKGQFNKRYVYGVVMGLLVVLTPVLHGYLVRNEYQVFFGAFAGQETGQQIYTLITPLTVMEQGLSTHPGVYPMIANVIVATTSVIGLIFVKKMKKNW